MFFSPDAVSFSFGPFVKQENFRSWPSRHIFERCFWFTVSLIKQGWALQARYIFRGLSMYIGQAIPTSKCRTIYLLSSITSYKRFCTKMVHGGGRSFGKAWLGPFSFTTIKKNYSQSNHFRGSRRQSIPWRQKIPCRQSVHCYLLVHISTRTVPPFSTFSSHPIQATTFNQFVLWKTLISFHFITVLSVKHCSYLEPNRQYEDIRFRRFPRARGSHLCSPIRATRGS